MACRWLKAQGQNYPDVVPACRKEMQGRGGKDGSDPGGAEFEFTM